jgi:peptide subunit release factor RF-3
VARLGDELRSAVRSELELLEVAGNAYDRDRFLGGEITPTFFGSALTNFGLEPFFDAFVELAPSPSGRMVDLPDGTSGASPTSPSRSARFVFKIQANMDPRHRDQHRLHPHLLGPLRARDERLSPPPGPRDQARRRPPVHGPTSAPTSRTPGAATSWASTTRALFQIGDSLVHHGPKDLVYDELETFSPEFFSASR